MDKRKIFPIGIGLLFVFMYFFPIPGNIAPVPKKKILKPSELTIVSVAFTKSHYKGKLGDGKFFKLCFNGPVKSLKQSGAYIALRFITKDDQDLSFEFEVSTQDEKSSENCTVHNLVLYTYGPWNREERTRRGDILEKSIIRDNIKECNVQLFTNKGGKRISNESFFDF